MKTTNSEYFRYITASTGVLLALLGASTAGCGGSDSEAAAATENIFGFGIPAIKPGTAPKSWDDAVARPESEAEAAAKRKACIFKRGALPGSTLGKEIPIGNGTAINADGTVNDTAIPIQHIIVMMQENRSFDSYYAHLAAWAANNVNDANGQRVSLTIDGATEPLSIPKSIDGSIPGTVDWVHADRLCFSDTNHEWFGAHIEWDGGRNDGFFQANQGFTEKGQPVVG